MNNQSVEEIVLTVIRKSFDVPDLPIDRNTVAEDVPGWDSVAHATLIMDVEAALNIEFDVEQVFGFETVGHLIDAATARVADEG